MADDLIQGGLQRITDRLQSALPAAVRSHSITLWQPSGPAFNFYLERSIYVNEQTEEVDLATWPEEKLNLAHESLHYLQSTLHSPAYPLIEQHFNRHPHDAAHASLATTANSLARMVAQPLDASSSHHSNRDRALSPFQSPVRAEYEVVIPDIVELSSHFPGSAVHESEIKTCTLPQLGHALSFLMHGDVCLAAWGHFQAAHVEYDVLLRRAIDHATRQSYYDTPRGYELLVITTPIH